MAATRTSCMLALLLAACMMAAPALASRHLTQDPTVPPGMPEMMPSPMPGASAAPLPGAGDLTGMNSTAGGNETSIQQCMMLLESYNITLVNTTTNETLTNMSSIGEAARSGRRTGGFGERNFCRGTSGNPALDCN